MKNKIKSNLIKFLKLMKYIFQEYVLLFLKDFIQDVKNSILNHRKSIVLSVFIHLIILFVLGYIGWKKANLPSKNIYKLVRVNLVIPKKSTPQKLEKKQFHKVKKKSEYTKKKERVKLKKKSASSVKKIKKKPKKSFSKKIQRKVQKRKTVKVVKTTSVPKKKSLKLTTRIAASRKQSLVKSTPKKSAHHISTKRYLNNLLEVSMDKSKKIKILPESNGNNEIKDLVSKKVKDKVSELKNNPVSSTKSIASKRAVSLLLEDKHKTNLKPDLLKVVSQESIIQKENLKVDIKVEAKDKNLSNSKRDSRLVVFSDKIKTTLETFEEKRGKAKLDVVGEFFVDSSPQIKKELKLGPFTDGLDTAPQISYYEPIEYPVWAEKKGIYGEITVKLFIGAEGKVNNIKVLKQTVGKKLSAYVVTKIRNWRFNPPLKDGKPTAAWIVQTINFKLRNI